MNWFKRAFKKEIAPAGQTDSVPPGIVDAPCNFTPRAQQVLALARKEADRLHHSFVGTEHLLLGLIRLGQGTAVNVLGRMGLGLETVRLEVEKIVGPAPNQEVFGYIPYTPRVKKVLALAAKEAKALNHAYVGTEHILLGLLTEGDGVAARVLKALDVDTGRTRVEILRELDPNYQPDGKSSGGSGSTNPQQNQADSVDLSKRYDVYCLEGSRVVVYRSALIKGGKALLRVGGRPAFPAFLELEQGDGQTVFVAGPSVLKFCEPGVTPSSETVSD